MTRRVAEAAGQFESPWSSVAVQLFAVAGLIAGIVRLWTLPYQ